MEGDNKSTRVQGPTVSDAGLQAGPERCRGGGFSMQTKHTRVRDDQIVSDPEERRRRVHHPGRPVEAENLWQQFLEDFKVGR